MRTRGWRGAETGRRIREQYADTGGFTDHVFAACSILGYAFASSPRTRARTSWRPADEAETRAAHTEPDAETRERLSLRSRSRVGSFLTAAMRGREVSGPEAEYRAALEIPDGIPLDLWEADRPVESRQDAAPPAPAAGTGVNLRPVLPYVFTPSLAGDLMVDMPSAQSGAYSEMVITSPLTAGPREKGTARASTGATLTAATTTPRSITARLNLTAEDVAAVGTDSFEAALRQNLSMALSDQLDEQLVNGDAAGQNLAGFLNQLADPDALGAVATWDTFNGLMTAIVDGVWALDLRQVRLCIAVKAWQLAATLFRDAVGQDLGDTSAASYLAAKTGGFKAAARLGTTDANISDGIAVRTGRPGMRTTVLPHWATINIDDIYSGAGSATRHVTLHTLVGAKVLILYADAYEQVSVQVA